MDKAQIEEQIANGHVRFHAVLEIVGKPQDHVEQTKKTILASLENHQKFTLLKQDSHDVEQLEKSDLFSTFTDVEVITPSMSHVYDFIFEYMPANMEIIDPERVTFTANQATNIINDLLAHVHNADMLAKESRQSNKILLGSLKTMIQNACILALLGGPRTAESAAKLVGVPENELEKYLQLLLKENKVTKEGDIYAVKK
ncbi:MAG: hypothetical protein ACI8Y7_000075 [Candidatus Woesearchaeota archaeon]|jgi:hypothetical protein